MNADSNQILDDLKKIVEEFRSKPPIPVTIVCRPRLDGWILKEAYDDVYCDQLVELIDEFVEK